MRRAALGALGKRRGAAAAAAATVPDTAPAARWGWRGRVFLPAGSGPADKGGGGGGGGGGACLRARALCGVARPRGARWFTSLGGAGEEEQGGEEENPRVFLDVKIGAEAPQRITFELFKQTVPLAAENFRLLCTGEKGQSPAGTALHYKHSRFFRVITEFMCQGGDITEGDGTGGESAVAFDDELYERTGKVMTEFRDENFRIKHSEAGLLAMANRGSRHTNTSQFYITFDECKWLNGKHVVFGTVVDGMQTLRAIEAVGSLDGTPTASVEVVDCGQL